MATIPEKTELTPQHAWSELSPPPTGTEEYHLAISRMEGCPAEDYQMHAYRFPSDRPDFWRLALHLPIEQDDGSPSGHLSEYCQSITGTLDEAKRFLEYCYDHASRIR